MTRSVRACVQCGKVGRNMGYGLCSACFSRRRREDPEKAERDRAASRAWKAANPEAVQRWESEQTHPCSDCGVLVTRKSKRCVACEHKTRSARYPLIQARWLKGESLKEIAAALDSSTNSLGGTIFRMRAQGWEMPYRHAKRRAAA